jgi:multiple sugar transport system substrate-binding protein
MCYCSPGTLAMIKKNVMALASIAVASLLAGFVAGRMTAPPKGAPSERAAPESPITLKVALWPDVEYCVDRLFEEFRQTHPNYSLQKIIFGSSEYEIRLERYLASGADLDVFLTKNNALYLDLTEKGMTQELDALVRNDKFDVSGYGPTYNAIKIHGRVYGLPTGMSTWLLFYNEALFKKDGVVDPVRDLSWAQFRDLARRLTRRAAQGEVWGAYLSSDPSSWLGPGLQTGATIIDEDLAPFEKGLELRLDMERDGSVVPYAEAKDPAFDCLSLFLDGRIAMCVMEDWMINRLREARRSNQSDVEWNIASVPHPEAVSPGTTWGMPEIMCIYGASAAKPVAWEFLKFAGGAAGARVYASLDRLHAFMLPDGERGIPRRSGPRAFPRDISVIRNQKVYFDYPPLPGMNLIVNFIYEDEFDLCLRGKESVAETFANIRQRIRYGFSFLNYSEP